MTGPPEPTFEQAWAVLSPRDQKIFAEKASQRPDFREELFELAKICAEEAYDHDWVGWAKEAAHGTVDCYGDEVLQADADSREIVDDLYRRLKTALPFLPAKFIAGSGLIVLEKFVESEYSSHHLVEDLYEFVKEVIESHPDESFSNLRTRMTQVETKLFVED